MHELSLIQEVMGILEKSALENNIESIKTVRLVVGKLVAALPDSMLFCFEALAVKPPFVNTRLEIEETEIRGKCRLCGHVFNIENYNFNCALCASSPVELVSGNEFYVAYYEGD